MIQDDLDKIEERLKQSAVVKESDKAELLTLLTTLRKEIVDLSQTHYELCGKHCGICQIISSRSHTQRKESGAPKFID